MKTEEQIRAIAQLLEADEEAKQASRWLWNDADSVPVRQRYFQAMVRAVLRICDKLEGAD